MEQSVKAQFEKLFDATDWWLYKTMAELNLKQAAELKKKDMPVPEPYQLVARNSGKRLLLGVGVELLLKSVYLKGDYIEKYPAARSAGASGDSPHLYRMQHPPGRLVEGHIGIP